VATTGVSHAVRFAWYMGVVGGGHQAFRRSPGAPRHADARGDCNADRRDGDRLEMQALGDAVGQRRRGARGAPPATIAPGIVARPQGWVRSKWMNVV